MGTHIILPMYEYLHILGDRSGTFVYEILVLQYLIVPQEDVMPNNSEVARLLESIRLSYESASLALHGTAMAAKHEFISRKMENMQQTHVELQALVGEQEAARLVAETLDATNDGKPAQA